MGLKMIEAAPEDLEQMIIEFLPIVALRIQPIQAQL